MPTGAGTARAMKAGTTAAVTRVQADHLQDIQVASLKDLLDRRAIQVQVHRVVVHKDLPDRRATQVQVHRVVDLVDLADIPAVDQAVRHSQVDQADLLNQEQVHHSRRKALRSQIVSTCHHGLDNCEAKLPANI